MMQRTLYRRKTLLNALVAALLATKVVAITGCASEGGAGGMSSGGPSTGPAAPTNTDRPPRGAIDLDAAYVIGPTAARELNYRIQWQYGETGGDTRLLTVLGDSVFIVDAQNFVTRINAVDGERMWRVQVADPIEQSLGVNLIGNEVYITSGSVIRVLDGNTGSMITRHNLQQIAATAPAEYGGFLIYGSRSGQIVWHSPDVGFQWRAYQVARAVVVKPLIHEGLVIAVGNDGTVIVLDASTTSQLWSKTLLNQVVAPPAAGNQMVYVAGLDQYVWAYDIASGRNIWHYLTSTPLRSGPVLVGDKLYQQVPGTGLVCLDAISFDSFGGKEIWVAPEITGSVILARRDELFTWDGTAKLLNVLTAARGGVKSAISLPQVMHITTGGENGESLFAASQDGRVVRLVPRT